mmetsp:Transcript_7447/g.18738  ORF Transcript_7447/g.18738 Transcript_7447/m.18738 type:complete len:201 (+) Transcript_7447:1371-1973(+)
MRNGGSVRKPSAVRSKRRRRPVWLRRPPPRRGPARRWCSSRKATKSSPLACPGAGPRYPISWAQAARNRRSLTRSRSCTPCARQAHRSWPTSRPRGRQRRRPRLLLQQPRRRPRPRPPQPIQLLRPQAVPLPPLLPLLLQQRTRQLRPSGQGSSRSSWRLRWPSIAGLRTSRRGGNLLRKRLTGRTSRSASLASSSYGNS